MPHRCPLSPLFVSLACAVTLAAAAPAQTSGWTYTMKMDVDSGQGSAFRNSTVMQYQIADHKLRMGFVQATGAMGGIEGMYTLFNDADSSLTTVMPNAHMASVMNMPAASAMPGALKFGTTHMTRTDIVDKGAGPRMLGHATRQFHMAVSGSIEFSMNGQSCVEPIVEDMDVWIAPDVDMTAVMGAMHGMSAMSSVDLPIDDPDVAKLPKGATLRSRMTKVITDAKGTPRTLTTSMEIIELTHGPVADAAFAVPADYKTMDMRKMMAKLPSAMMDSTIQAMSAQMMATLCSDGSQKP